MKKFFKALIITLCGVMMLSALGLVACAKQATKPTEGTVTGIVMDSKGNALTDAKVFYVETIDDEEETITTEPDENGKFELENVSVGNLTLNITCDGYGKVTKELTEATFNMEGVASLGNIVMEEGKGVVKGRIVMKGHTSVPVVGADIKVQGNAAVATTTGEDGYFTLENVPMLGQGAAGTTTINITKTGYASTTQSVSKRQFSNAKDGTTVEVGTIALEENDLYKATDFSLKGFKPYNLGVDALAADKTTINSKADISSLFLNGGNKGNGVGGVETHDEGYCINSDTNDAAKYNSMGAWISAKIVVDANHKYLTVKATSFGYDPVRPALGLYVVHAKEGNEVSISDYDLDDSFEFKPIESTDPMLSYATFDLSAYENKTVVIIIGTNYGYHCVVKEIAFANEKPVEPDYAHPAEVKDTEGLSSSLIVDKDNWNIGGATNSNSNGITLNDKDPWKGIAIDAANPQPINSYMYRTYNVSADKSIIKFSATILDLANCIETAGNAPGFYYAYLKILAIKVSDGKVVASSNWFSPWKDIDDKASTADKKPVVNEGAKKDYVTAVNEGNKQVTLKFNLSAAAAVDEDVIIIIACNVGYRATILPDTIDFVGDIEASDKNLEVLIPEQPDGGEEGGADAPETTD